MIGEIKAFEEELKKEGDWNFPVNKECLVFACGLVWTELEKKESIREIKYKEEYIIKLCMEELLWIPGKRFLTVFLISSKKLIPE